MSTPKNSLPDFDSIDMEIWLMYLKAAFSINSIRNGMCRFNVVIDALDSCEKFVRTVIINCNASGTFSRSDGAFPAVKNAAN